MFNSLDNVICLARLRKQLCTFERIKPQVQRFCGREFTLQHLARILTVYPTAFRMHRVPVPGAHAQSEQHFDIALDLDDDDSIRIVTPLRAELKLNERRQEFARRLRDATAQHCRCATIAAEASTDAAAAGDLATAGACEGGCIPTAPLPPLHRAAAETTAAAARAPNLTAHVAALTPPDPDSPSPAAPVDMDPIVARLRARDRAAAAAAARPTAEVAAEERRRCGLPALADALRASLRQRRRTSDYLAAVAADLAATLPARLPPREVARRLRMLPAVVPEWCSVDDGGSGSGGSGGGGGAARKPVLRVNWELDYTEVRSMLLFMLTDSNDEGADGGGGGGGSSSSGGGSRSHAGSSSIGAGAARLMQAVR
ncbi:hypothetical protein JKP88DRAFT_332853 [Tribonema minus]|uniref:CDT1 Geminin-binding domain-containing protein n=1 Tax=Tribonema minus TaxID=303371 RepID=A0A835YLC5_9STRA|nr:hypothetical protein JKP88DRAFT_332853 [Tribonema minus]